VSGIDPCADAYGLLRRLLTMRGADDSGLAEPAVRVAAEADGTVDPPAWQRLAEEAEYHGVAPLVEPMVASLAAGRPDREDVRLAFVALASRHRRAAAAREASVDQLLTAFGQADVPIILLKGAALAHLIYPSPVLRPMVDIDVLVAPDDVARAAAISRGLGYSFAAEYGSRFAARMHHLTPATIDRAGFRISLEIHTDTMSPDQAGSLTFQNLSAPPRRFRRNGGPDGLCLGHLDMLRHLARHAFEPARRIRLIHLYDLWRYRRLLDGAIDWEHLAARLPEVNIALSLVSQVFPGQQCADDPCRVAGTPVPAGVGLGMVPLSEIAMMEGGPLPKLAALFDPPAWWLHGFYAVPLGHSLLLCRAVRHPAMVARWLIRRLLARAGLIAKGDA
jgi:hypothetical protein